jgi:hypothetical protein
MIEKNLTLEQIQDMINDDAEAYVQNGSHIYSREFMKKLLEQKKQIEA